MSLVAPQDETIAGAAALLRDGRRSCVELTEACLGRIAARDEQLRAWVRVDRDGALRRAGELDAKAAAGRWLGPLHGIPLGIKDIVDVAGWPTAAGSPRLAGTIAERDAPLVQRLRAAGAVLLGKTVTTPFASFDPPPTRNPWHADRTPGGSSSGSAAAVAAGMCLGAVGSQTGGSITRPASYCGVAGCKPSYGLLPVEGVLPLASSLDHPGPIARTVRDLALMLDAMSGGQVPARPDGDSLSTPPRLGRLRGLFEAQAEPSMRAATETAIAALRAAGARVIEIELPAAFDDVLRSHRVVMAAEAAAWHRQRFAEYPDDYQPCIRSLIEEGLAMDAAEYIRCRWHQADLTRAMAGVFGSVDALIGPATSGPAPDRATTGDPAFNSPWSYTGLPTVSFPVALSPDGLPLALQLVGRAAGDADLLATAAWCEDALGRA